MKIFFVIGAAVSAITFFPAIIFGQEPNLSGTWTLNHSKSDYGEIGLLPNMTYEIKHEGLRLSIEVLAEGHENESRENIYTTDGGECLNNGQGLKGLKSTCRIEGGKVIIEGEAEGATATGAPGEDPVIEYFKYRMTQEFSLSPDRSELTIVEKLETSEGPKNITLVFDRKTS